MMCVIGICGVLSRLTVSKLQVCSAIHLKNDFRQHYHILYSSLHQNISCQCPCVCVCVTCELYIQRNPKTLPKQAFTSKISSMVWLQRTPVFPGWHLLPSFHVYDNPSAPHSTLWAKAMTVSHTILPAFWRPGVIGNSPWRQHNGKLQ